MLSARSAAPTRSSACIACSRSLRSSRSERGRPSSAGQNPARALVGQPRLLLLDEPASGLPENELPELGELITKLAAGAGVVVIEHRMDLVMSVCDRIFVLDFGKLIAVGTPEEVQADPAVTAAYLGAEGGTGDD